MTSRRRAISFIILVLLTQPLFLFGQSGSDRNDWGNVKALPPGVSLSVETKDGKSFAGKLETVSDTTLTLTRKNKTDSIESSNIKKVYRTGGGSRGKSIAIATGVGAGVGAGASAALLGATGGSDETALIVAIGVAVGAGIGAALGAAFGGHKRTLIFESK